MLVGEDEDIEATDERVGGRKLVCAVEWGRGEGEVEEVENLKAVVRLDVGDGVGDVGRWWADVEANTVGQWEALPSCVDVECNVGAVDGEVVDVYGDLRE